MTTILGVKAQHDGGFAVVRDGKLLCSIEWEKLDNNARHARPETMGEIARQLVMQTEMIPSDIDVIAFDSWWPDAPNWIDVPLGEDGEPVRAPYVEPSDDLMRMPRWEGTMRFGGREVPTSGWPHATGHVFGAYCTSPFGVPRGTSGGHALVLVWDGGMPATLYAVSSAAAGRIAVVLPITGNLYPMFCSRLAPYRDAWLEGPAKDFAEGEFGNESWSRFNLGVPGKAMAYAGLGRVVGEAIDIFVEHRDMALCSTLHADARWIRDLRDDDAWAEKVHAALAPLGLPDASLMASFQEWLWIELRDALARYADPEIPLVFTGGCALNIKWNSALRRARMFEDVWVPPFPNDAGGALGVACAEMFVRYGEPSLDWNVFSGPKLRRFDTPPRAWTARQLMSRTELGQWMHATGNAVVVLQERAECGPRALGHRSILAPATEAGTKQLLNAVKRREDYRPVAPICLVNEAPRIFDPGTPDPYMLFDHRIRAAWLDRIPAVAHVDGTARLQTVGTDNLGTWAILKAYYEASGVPVLCNTSANNLGAGFFPDAASAMKWGRIGFVWSEGVLYEKIEEAGR